MLLTWKLDSFKDRAMIMNSDNVPSMISSETRIGWIGTGVMGLSMCNHLLTKGYKVKIYSRTKAKA